MSKPRYFNGPQWPGGPKVKGWISEGEDSMNVSSTYPRENWLISCSVCDQTFNEWGSSKSWLVGRAVQAGWKRIKGLLYCPPCREQKFHCDNNTKRLLP